MKIGDQSPDCSEGANSPSEQKNKRRKTIHSPNYKECGIGFTMTPTCVMENPHQWGLRGNSFRLWAYLVSRIKKEQYFNGRTIKAQLTGTMGESAVAAALKEMCDLGFCTKQVNHDQHGQFAGWAYTFYAIPKNRARVHQIAPGICEKLSAFGWFDLPDDGNPLSGVVPDDGSPLHGEAPFKEREKTQEKEENQDTTPNPLLEKEGVSSDLSGKVDPQPLSPAPSESTTYSETPASLTGQHLKKMSQSAVGSRLLGMLRPAQIPGDKALRPLSREVEKGAITDAYLTFLWEKMIGPNQESSDKEGIPLKSVPEILKFVKGDSTSPDSETFKRWRSDRIRDLKQRWRKAYENLSLDEFWRLVEERASGGPFDGIDFDGEKIEPSRDCTPFRLFIYWRRCVTGDHFSYCEKPLLEALYDGAVWNHLLDEAATSHEQFLSLKFLVKDLKDKLPPNRTTEVQELWEDFPARHSANMKEVGKEFADMGATPPQIAPVP